MPYDSSTRRARLDEAVDVLGGGERAHRRVGARGTRVAGSPGAEHRHDAVADELVDHPAVPEDHPVSTVKSSLRKATTRSAAPLGEARERRHVGEEHGDRAPAPPRARRCSPRATADATSRGQEAREVGLDPGPARHLGPSPPGGCRPSTRARRRAPESSSRVFTVERTSKRRAA